jgi:diaminopimelate epimerase
VNGEDMTIATGAGLKRLEVKLYDGDGLISVEMGRPDFAPCAIPIAMDEEAIDMQLELSGRDLRITTLSMGNPHCVLFTALPDWQEVGRALEKHPLFPERTNVEFAEVLSPQEIRLFVWERGAGATLACGTGACATVAAGVRLGRLNHSVAVTMPGGVLGITAADDGTLTLTGPAEFVFTGVM